MDNEIRASYDKDAEVLYVYKGKSVPAVCEYNELGLLYRYAMFNNQPCGVTVTHFEIWSDKISQLSLKISNFLSVPTPDVTTVIQIELDKNK